MTSPPSSPAIGDTYLIPTGATGAWSGLAGQLSQWTGTDGWHTRAMPTQHMVGVGDRDDFYKRMPDGSWRSIFATIPEAEAGTSSTLAITPICLRRAASIRGTAPSVLPCCQKPHGHYSTSLARCRRCVPRSADWCDRSVTSHPNDLAQWDGVTWLYRSYPTTSLIGIGSDDDWYKRMLDGTWRTAYATLAEASKVRPQR